MKPPHCKEALASRLPSFIIVGQVVYLGNLDGQVVDALVASISDDGTFVLEFARNFRLIDCVFVGRMTVRCLPNGTYRDSMYGRQVIIESRLNFDSDEFSQPVFGDVK